MSKPVGTTDKSDAPKVLHTLTEKDEYILIKVIEKGIDICMNKINDRYKIIGILEQVKLSIWQDGEPAIKRQ